MRQLSKEFAGNVQGVLPASLEMVLSERKAFGDFFVRTEQPFPLEAPRLPSSVEECVDFVQ